MPIFKYFFLYTDYLGQDFIAKFSGLIKNLRNLQILNISNFPIT